MKAAEFANDLFARTEHEMIRIAKYALRARLFEQPDFHALDRTARSDRHKSWELDDAARRFKGSSARAAVCVFVRKSVFKKGHLLPDSVLENSSARKEPPHNARKVPLGRHKKHARARTVRGRVCISSGAFTRPRRPA